MIRITGLGIYLPEQRQSAADIAEASGVPEWVVRDKMGLKQKPVPGPDDHTNAMGIRAARAALADAGREAAELDMLVSITEEHKEYPVWTAGIHATHELGANKAYAFDVGQKCGTALLALKIARDMMTADSGVRFAAIAGGYRNGDLIDYQDKNVSFLYNLAAGGGAATLGRSGPGFEILGSAFRTDGSFSEDVIVPVGGTRHPYNGGNGSDFRFTVPDPAGMKGRLEQLSLDNFVGVAEDACEKSGIKPSEISYAAVLHMKRSAHDMVLSRLGIDADRSIYLSDYGHIGQIDPLLSLKLARDQGRFKPGDTALLLAAGIGYVWNALCVRWTLE